MNPIAWLRTHAFDTHFDRGDSLTECHLEQSTEFLMILETLEKELEAARRERDEARKGLAAVEILIRESYGVAGLHLNGDVAPWDELRTGGKFEGWLCDFDSALKQTPQAGKEPQ